MVVIKKVKEVVEQNTVDKVICEVCKTEYTDEAEIQEMQMIRFTAGYGSVFGDGSLCACDICQHCMKKVLGKYIRIEENVYVQRMTAMKGREYEYQK
jgi:hypothetical protein